MTAPKLDPNGSCIEIDKINGLVRVDGVPVFRLVVTGDVIRVQFHDSNKMRSKYRGSNLIEVPLDALTSRLVDLCD